MDIFTYCYFLLFGTNTNPFGSLCSLIEIDTDINLLDDDYKFIWIDDILFTMSEKDFLKQINFINFTGKNDINICWNENSLINTMKLTNNSIHKRFYRCNIINYFKYDLKIIHADIINGLFHKKINAGNTNNITFLDYIIMNEIEF
jgi:hypothetical protein